MHNKNLVQKARLLGLPFLLWCCAPVLFSGTVSAQCKVFFSSCPGAITIVDCDNSGDEAISWPLPVAATWGGCTNFIMTQVSGPAPGSMVAVPGVYSVVYTAYAFDIATGKTSKAYCKITINVVPDQDPPVFTSCPADITLYAGTGTTAIGLWPNPIATDNCDVIVKTDTPCKTEFDLGTHQVLYSATDPSGNVVYCTFNVTVLPGFLRPEGPKNNNVPFRESQKVPTLGKAQREVLLMPNPFTQLLVLYADKPVTTDMVVHVVDINGRVLRTQDWLAHNDQLTVDAGDIKPGVLFVKIISADGSYAKVLRAVKL